MKKIFIVAIMLVAFSQVSLAKNSKVKSKHITLADRGYVCTLETDTCDGGCCTQVGSSTVSQADACNRAAKQPCN